MLNGYELSTLHNWFHFQMPFGRDVNKFFKTLTKLASSSVFSLVKSENNWLKNIERESQMGKKLARLASGFVFLLANPKFYSQLASWRVVIRTPAFGVAGDMGESEEDPDQLHGQAHDRRPPDQHREDVHQRVEPPYSPSPIQRQRPV
jgi:hypothetical protein